MIIATSKTTLSNAEAYTDFILKHIKQKDLFSWIELQPHRYWEIFFFMDNSNFGGIRGDIDSSSSSFLSSSSSPADPKMIISNWNINEYLPIPAQNSFLYIISDYLLHLQKLNKSSLLLSTSTNKENDNPNQVIAASISTDDDDAIGSDDAATSQLINDYLTQKLFRLIEDIQNTLGADHSRKAQGDIDQSSQASAEFPRLAGSHLPLNNPALEFIKSVCQVLSLDKSIENAVFRLRKVFLSHFITSHRHM